MIMINESEHAVDASAFDTYNLLTAARCYNIVGQSVGLTNFQSVVGGPFGVGRDDGDAVTGSV